MVRTTLVVALLCGASGCSDLPEVQYHREGFDLAVEFDHPVCEGTLAAMEERVELVAHETDRLRDTPMTIYWLEGELERICPRPTSGCFIPGTQIVASTGGSLHHEIVHAVMNTRGSNPFAEEGLAEVLSGVAAYRPADDRGNPLSSFGLSRKDARDGEVDYDRAAHFMHFVRREAGERTIAALTDAIDRDDSPAQITEMLERELERSAAEIEAEYAEAPVFFPSSRVTETASLGEIDLTAGVDLPLDCGDASTLGPLSEDDGGMYHVRRIATDGRVEGTLYFAADPGVRASLFREADPNGKWIQNWWAPEPHMDEERIDLRPGERVWVSLNPADHWLLMIRSSDSDTVKNARLHLAR